MGFTTLRWRGQPRFGQVNRRVQLYQGHSRHMNNLTDNQAIEAPLMSPTSARLRNLEATLGAHSIRLTTLEALIGHLGAIRERLEMLVETLEVPLEADSDKPNL